MKRASRGWIEWIRHWEAGATNELVFMRIPTTLALFLGWVLCRWCVNRVVPAAELDAAVDYYVERLAIKLPQTLRYTKQQLNWWRDLSWHETVGHARDWLSMSMLGDEAKEAIQAFLSKGSRDS